VKRIALIPVYNEEATLPAVMESLVPLVDLLLVVDDGSSDRSLALARERALREPRIRVLALQRNSGMSAALRAGFLHLVSRMQAGELDPDDVVFTMDADGQHDAGQLESLSLYFQDRALDVALTRRDFALYPWHKRLGNRFMTLWGSLWSGFSYHDVESGFRALRLGVLPPLMEYYTGYRYSCAQEIAILTARLGFRVDNGFVTAIRRYRSQTRLQDVFINALLGAWAFVRWRLNRRSEARSWDRCPARQDIRR
jgi:glycosyltransferase involved in cell wall biosynthesis